MRIQLTPAFSYNFPFYKQIFAREDDGKETDGKVSFEEI